MKEILDKLIQKQELSKNEVDEVVFGLKENRFSDTLITDFLMAFIMKGTTTAELVAIASAIRRACAPISPRFDGSLASTELSRLICNQGLPG